MPTAARRAPPPRTDFYQRRVGSDLTPQVVTAAFGQADRGRMWTLADLLDEAREVDAHLHAVLHKREWQVAGAAWEIRPFDDSRPAKRAAKYVEDALKSLRSFSAALAHLQSAPYHGRAVGEVIWARDGGRLLPVAIEPVHARRVSVAEDWRLCLYDSGALGSPYAHWPGVPLDAFPPGKFLVHTPRIRGVYPQREGLGRPLLFMSLFKRWAIRDALALAEMAGRKGRVGKYSTGADGKPRATPEDVDELEDALQDWSSAVALVIPDTTEVAFEDPVSGNTIHGPLVELMNSEMSKAVLGGTLTTDPGTRGARSLGETQQDDQLMIARGDARAVEETVRFGLFVPMVREKYGDGYPAPYLSLMVEPKQDANAVMDRLEKFVRVGGKVSQEDARNLLGLPDPAPDAELLEPATGPNGGARAKPGATADGAPPPREDDEDA